MVASAVQIAEFKSAHQHWMARVAEYQACVAAIAKGKRFPAGQLDRLGAKLDDAHRTFMEKSKPISRR